MALSSASVTRSRTKERSIFNISTEKRFKQASEEYPVPKSSIAILAPNALSALIFSAASCGSSIKLLSVISNSRAFPGKPLFTITCRIISQVSSLQICFADKLIAIFGSFSPVSFQLKILSITRSKILTPNDVISPVSSATDINSFGTTSPNLADFHRHKASSPTSSPVSNLY